MTEDSRKPSTYRCGHTWIKAYQASKCSKLEAVTQPILGPNPRIDSFEYCLRCAIAARQLDIARNLLENGALIDEDVIDAALVSKSVAVFQMLLDHGWDINRNYNGGVIFPYISYPLAT